ncbi:MAG: acyl-CoA dehydrogenase family protein, partial [Terriglobales bacterium]
MEFSWTEEQRQGYEQARQFAQRELALPHAEGGGNGAEASGDRSGGREDMEPWRARWRQCAGFGVQALNIPTRFGGLGLETRSAVHVLEGLGFGCADNGLLMALGAQIWSVTPPLLNFGTEEQKRLWLPGFADGSCVAAFALTEPESGSDVFHLRLRGEPDGGGFRLHGNKAFITNAPVADLFLVFAATEANGGYFGLTAFLLQRGQEGVEVGPPLRKMGLETSPMAELRLDGAWVGPQAMLGEVGGGGAVVLHTLEWERGCLLAPALGTLDRLLQATTAYARARKQFGRPIIEFEAVGQKLAEMRLRLELSRLLVYQFAWLKDQGRSAGVEACMTKLYVS